MIVYCGKSWKEPCENGGIHMVFMIYVGVFGGIALIALYAMGIGIYAQVKGKDVITKKHKLIYKVLLGIESILILAMLLLPKVTKSNFLPEGMSDRSVVVNTDDNFKVSFAQANRGWSNQVTLTQNELDNVRVKCSAEEGTVYLAITQNQKEQVMDVTNLDTKLDLSTYQVGDITFSISNENAKNVDFELIW